MISSVFQLSREILDCIISNTLTIEPVKESSKLTRLVFSSSVAQAWITKFWYVLQYRAPKHNTITDVRLFTRKYTSKEYRFLQQCSCFRLCAVTHCEKQCRYEVRLKDLTEVHYISNFARNRVRKQLVLNKSLFLQ